MHQVQELAFDHVHPYFYTRVFTGLQEEIVILSPHLSQQMMWTLMRIRYLYTPEQIEMAGVLKYQVKYSSLLLSYLVSLIEISESPCKRIR